MTNRTWHKAAEKSLKDASISTVGDLCKLTELQASTLKGIKPPNNIQTIREAMKKFEKLLTKREKISQANSALKEDESEGGQLTRTSSNSSLASIIETSTPDEEDKMMKVYNTEPSYQNKSSDSVSRKQLDGFKNAFNIKWIFIFDSCRFVSTILLNSKT